MSARWDEKTLYPPSPVGDSGPLDPYVRWLVASEGRGLAQWHNWKREGAEGLALTILAWTADPAQLDALGPNMQPGVQLPSIYLTPVGGTRSHFFTARVSGQAGFDWLIENPLRLQWKVALPLRDAQRAAQASPKGRFGPTRDQADMQAENRVAHLFPDRRRLNHPKPALGLIAVIDFGCPFLHDRFATGPSTRLVGLWDQGQEPTRGSKAALPAGTAVAPPAGWPWKRPLDFDTGRELGPLALQSMRNFATGQSAPDETLIYRGLDYLIAYDDPRRRVWYATHGSMVLDLAGGDRDPMNPQGDPDAASKAPLLFIDLPTLTAADSAGCSLGAHVLDGVRYAMKAAHADDPLVVVLSYGNSAGPHDGSSLIERALDELIEARGDAKTAIVLAAGNARSDGGHVRRRVARDRSALLRLLVVEGDTTDTFMEIWYPRGGEALDVRVRSPQLVWSPWVLQGQEVLMRSTDAKREFVAMLRHDREVPNGQGAMVLLALAPSAQPADVDGALVEPGLWEIELRLSDGASSPVDLDAWIERDDPIRGSGGTRTRFIDVDDGDDYNTLNGMATGSRTYKAAGYNLETGQPTRYSSLPDRNRPKPDPRLVLAACEEDTLQPTVAAAATRSSDVFRMNGTSVAAPVLARRLFNAMMRPDPIGPRNPSAPQDLLSRLSEDEQKHVKPFEPD